jgi:hypothetical protein
MPKFQPFYKIPWMVPLAACIALFSTQGSSSLLSGVLAGIGCGEPVANSSLSTFASGQQGTQFPVGHTI